MRFVALSLLLSRVGLQTSDSSPSAARGDAPSLDEIQKRLLRLERQNRRLKQTGAAALIAATSLLLMGQASRLNTVEASQFILKDKSGKVRAALSIDERSGNSGPVQLVFYDGEGRQRVKLDSGTAFFGGALHLADENGKDRTYISSSDALGGGLSLLDSNGLPGTVINTAIVALPDVEAKSVSLQDADGHVRARLFMTQKHTATVGEVWPNMPLSSEAKNTPITFSPSPTLALYDLEGKAHVYIDGEGNISAGNVAVSDSQGHTLGSLTALTNYGALLSLDNGKGEQRLLLEPPFAAFR